VFPAVVVDVRDPDGQGRVRVELPWAPDAGDARWRAWARVATLMAGDRRGSWFVPDVRDEVLVAFEGGDPRRPYVLGALWNGADAPPERMDGAGSNDRKVLRSRNGLKVTLDDAAGRESLVPETPAGQRLTLQDGPGAVTLEDANGNRVRLEAGGVSVVSAGRLTVQASAVDVSATALTVNAGMSRFNGAVQAQTVIATTVVGATYTPGAGNIW
jgi:uncharacterized protein involved in type VI secretion and phage assembly